MLPIIKDFKFHHIGFATTNINKTASIFEQMGYRFGPITTDNTQKVKIAFIQKEGYPDIELIEPLNNEAPVNNILNKVGNGVYHLCYTVSNMEAAIIELRKLKFLPVSKPEIAPAINLNKVVFLYNSAFGLVELVEVQNGK